jgi:hypothetical protein
MSPWLGGRHPWLSKLQAFSDDQPVLYMGKVKRFNEWRINPLIKAGVGVY